MILDGEDYHSKVSINALLRGGARFLRRPVQQQGQVILGLYCGGESAPGSSQHGLGRYLTQDFIAGKEAANEPG